MRQRSVVVLGLLATLPAAAACQPSAAESQVPGLASRGTTMTTVRPVRQDLTNRMSLSGTVTIGPVFGLVSPVAGQVRYLDVRPPRTTPTGPTRVATVWANGKAHHVAVPAGAVFAGRLVDDRSTVPAGMPIVSAKHVGYGIVAEIDGARAYQLSDSPATVRAQISNGPGPFTCTVLGTIAALPAGVIPPPPTQPPATQPPATQQPPMQQPARQSGGPPTPAAPAPGGSGSGPGASQGSAATGPRLVCTAPATVRLINGASVSVEVVTEKAVNVLVLPVEAVAGGQGAGKVDVVLPDRTRQTRDVVLGLTDGRVVEIRSGLTGDEEIAVPGPDLAPVAPGPTDRPGGPVVGK